MRGAQQAEALCGRGFVSGRYDALSSGVYSLSSYLSWGERSLKGIDRRNWKPLTSVVFPPTEYVHDMNEKNIREVVSKFTY